MEKAIKFTSWTLVLMMIPLMLFTSAMAQESPIKITLVSDKTSYAPDDPIWIQVRVSNTTQDNVISRYGFFDKDFHLSITFIDPNGEPITTRFSGTAADEGNAPYRYKGYNAIPVQIIPPLPDPDGEKISIMNDARHYYDLTSTGWYMAEVRVPLETFTEHEAAHDGLFLAPLDDPGRQAYSPLRSNKIRFEIASLEPGLKSSINVKVSHLKIGGGTHPGATKTPLPNIPVRLILKSKIPEELYPINFKSYPLIWAVDAAYSKLTDPTNGIAKFDQVPQDDYVVLALYNESQDFRHMGSPIGADDSDWLTEAPIEKNLMVIEKEKGKKVPGKTKRLKGSELLITEPEYVTWDTAQETYPFIFEAVGDWGVVTEIIPPEGFVSDYNSLDAKVVNELEAVQFTVTDVGSTWVPSCVKYTVKHNKKRQQIYRAIGLQLTKKMAEEKGIDIRGMAETARETDQEIRQYCQELEQENKQRKRERDQETKPKGKKN